ncbi:MAG TPA: acyltransferase [Bryobacteraceae bacterium]|nr:acyltransferase [Bryobacteraceae bacterium]
MNRRQTSPDASDYAAAPATRHISALDGLRGIAVLMVICFHFWQGFARGPYTIVGRLAVWGQTGVDLFFVLSGFLITRILLDSKGNQDFFKNFYVRRILRIFPLYYATLCAVYFVAPLMGTGQWTPWRQASWFWFYMQNIPMTFAPSLAIGPAHFWSLSVEEHYYLLWPLLVARLDCKRLLRVCVLAVGVSLLTRVILFRYGAFYFTLARLDGLAIGSALAVLARSNSSALGRLAGPARGLLAGLGVLLAATQLIASGSGQPVVQVLKSTLIAVVYACVIILSTENKLGRSLGALLSSRALRSVGKYSYGMYVIHPFMLGWLHGTGIVPFGFPGLVVSMVLTYAAAWLSWTVLEHPFLKLKRHFEYASSDSRRVILPRIQTAQPALPGGA